MKKQSEEKNTNIEKRPTSPPQPPTNPTLMLSIDADPKFMLQDELSSTKVFF
jgi:hypothetical protein